MNLKNGVVIISPGCNNNCVFCGPYPPTPTAKELKIQEINIAKNLKEFETKGINHIEISGADPIEYDKLPELVAYIKSKGFSAVLVSTHGRDLNEGCLRDRLVKAGVDCFRVPLYGSTPKVHESITQSPGSFAETYQGLKKYREESPHTQFIIQTVVVQSNKEDLCGIIDLMVTLGLDNLNVSIAFPSLKDYSFYLPLKDIKPYLTRLYEYSSARGINIRFVDFPFCAFGFCDKNKIFNVEIYPDYGEHCQPQEPHASGIKDTPKYRLKTRAKICEKCTCKGDCAGFPLLDYEKYGPGDLKPIL